MAVSNYRILWTIPSLPYSTRSGLYANNAFLIQSAYINASHATEYSLEYGESLTFSAVLQEYRTYSTTRETSYYDFSWIDKDGVTHYVYQYWSNVEAQIKFYHGDYSQWDYITDLPDTNLITGVNNNNSTQQVTDYEVTAVATIGAGSTQNYITNDHITIKLVPDETDFGIYIGDSSTSPMTVTLPDSGSYTKNIKVYCTSTGNYLTSGSFYFTGDQFIYDNCTITPEIKTTVKQAFIEAKIDTSQGVLYKPYSGTFIVTGSVQTDTSVYSNSLTINFAPGEDDLIDLNVPNEFALTYSEEVIINAELLSVPGLILKVTIPSVFTGLNADNTPKFIPDISTYTTSGSNKIKISDPADNGMNITLKHNVRQLAADSSGNITIEAYEYTQDPSTGVITLGTKYATKIIRVIFDKIWMPDPITVIINQKRKKIYFEFREYNSTTGTYDASVRAYEGDVYEPNMVYPAQGSDINVFTKKYKLACYGSDWQIAGIVDSSDNAINWVQTSLDDGLDYEIYKAVYSFSIWTNPNPYIVPRDGYIKLVSKKTDNGNPRATVRIKVHQEKACYEPDFTLTLVPLVETAADSNVLADSSICSPFTLSPVYGKKYQIRVTNNCDYDILHIQSVAVEGAKPTPLYYKNMFPDIDSSLDTNNTGINSSNWNIDIADIYGKLNPDTSVGSTNPYYSRKAITLLLPAMGYIPSSDPILDKYVSFKVTCYNESYGDGPDASGNYHIKTVNTDPRHLHQIGRLRSAAFEGYDYNPEAYPITPLDKLYAFSNDDIKLFDETAPTHKAFSIRTGIEILPILDSDSNQVTRGVEDSNNPLWNINQILDERCIVIAWNKLDDFLQNPVHRPRPS